MPVLKAELYLPHSRNSLQAHCACFVKIRELVDGPVLDQPGGRVGAYDVALRELLTHCGQEPRVNPALQRVLTRCVPIRYPLAL
jgi:hypothetical protein